MADTTNTGQKGFLATDNAGVVTSIRDIDALDKLLFFGIIFFVFILIYLARFEANDGQTFQVISGLITGFAGAFFGRMKPKADKTPDANSTTAVTPAPTPDMGGASGTNK